MDFERNYQVKTLSKQLIHKKFSTLASSKLNPWFISGLIDAEGSFTLVICKNQKRKLGWRTDPKFQIGLHKRDLDLLYQIQQTLGGIGNIHKDKIRNRVIYSIDSIKDLTKLIVHFDNYPLLTQKAADYILFKQAIDLLKNKVHLTQAGLNKFVGIKASMNKGLSNKLKLDFKKYHVIQKPLIYIRDIPSVFWIAGFVSGEGCFDIRVIKTKTKLAYRVQLRFRITQHIRDLKLMQSIIFKLGCGTLYKYPKQKAVSIVVVDFSNITNIIIPLFDKYPIQGVKLSDYLDWCSVHNLMANKQHLTVEGLKEIEKIKTGINKSRK